MHTNWAGGMCGSWNARLGVCLDNLLLQRTLEGLLGVAMRFPSHACPLSLLSFNDSTAKPDA